MSKILGTGLTSASEALAKGIVTEVRAGQFVCNICNTLAPIVLGGLLSAHLLIEDPVQRLGDLRPEWYNGELLDMASDLAARLLPAFSLSPTGIPHPRVNLRSGVPYGGRTDTCTAGAGTLLVEFGILSKLSGDPTYQLAARRASRALWNRRHNTTELLGNVLDVNTGKWMSELSGVGAGLDSFYEYMLKSYVLFGEREDYDIGGTHTSWIDSLQAAFAGLQVNQVLAGDVEEAICTHALYWSIWQRFGVLPERYNWQRASPDVLFYPLRPEFAEATYLLYRRASPDVLFYPLRPEFAEATYLLYRVRA
ncbi:hypothetical protein HAZT_HAZT000129 [Hyalella azteca]|uniref:alpha-1,2-Mannosidase n=1 Tax=Hyalella azteca TaxID=294128 RepID=A0A6A0GRT9_HYAAZ|nr:hypothetical protein HAZT_HAZT000129 [Hyalella azteca]